MANPKVSAQYQAHLGKTSFNESAPLDFSSAPGMCLPVYYLRMNAGEKFRGRVNMISRTEDLETKTFTQIHEFCDWFFVPYEQIFREFGSWYTQVDDVQSSLISDTDFMMQQNNIAFPGVEASKIFNLFPYISNLADYLETCSSKYTSKSARAAAVSDFFDRSAMKQYAHAMLDIFGYPSVLGTIRLFELLGHRLRKDTDEDYASFLHVSYDEGQADTISSVNMARGYEQLDLWAAYQKIWYDYFRDTDYTPNDRFAYNLDRFAVWENPEMDAQKNHSGGMFQLRYRRWNVTYQNNFLPSPLQSIVGMLGQDGAGDPTDPSKILMGVRQWLQDVSPLLVDFEGNTVSPGIPPTSIMDGYTPDNSPVSMDTLYALRKISEVTRRAGKHYDDQVLAHFGFRMPRQVTGEVYHIGQSHCVIQLAQVVSTAETSEASLGKIGAKGYGEAHSDEVEFTAPCPGLIMCIHSSMPEVIQPYGTDKLITGAYREDWYHPAFDRLGMQPLFRSELSIRDYEGEKSEVVAWQYRYLHEKMKYARSAGNLGLGATRSYWSPNLEDLVSLDDPVYGVIHLRYVSPDCMNSFMKVQYDSYFNYESDESYSDYYFNTVCAFDPLIHHFEFKCSKDSYMSAYGLPEL